MQEPQAKAGLTPHDADWGLDLRPGQLVCVGEDGKEQQTTVVSERGAYSHLYLALRDAVLDQGLNPVPPEQAIAVMEVLEAGRLSGAERREVPLSDRFV